MFTSSFRGGHGTHAIPSGSLPVAIVLATLNVFRSTTARECADHKARPSDAIR
jgi:hypothetical protein